MIVTPQPLYQAQKTAFKSEKDVKQSGSIDAGSMVSLGGAKIAHVRLTGLVVQLIVL